MQCSFQSTTKMFLPIWKARQAHCNSAGYIHIFYIFLMQASNKCNIQTAAKVSIFWLNLKEWWPFFLTTWMSTLSTIPEILQELLGVELYCPFIYYIKIIWAPTQISIKNCSIRTTLFTHSLKASIVHRNTESSRTNSDLEKAWSLNLNFLQLINGMISVFPLTAQLRK